MTGRANSCSYKKVIGSWLVIDRAEDCPKYCIPRVAYLILGAQTASLYCIVFDFLRQ